MGCLMGGWVGGLLGVFVCPYCKREWARGWLRGNVGWVSGRECKWVGGVGVGVDWESESVGIALCVGGYKCVGWLVRWMVDWLGCWFVGGFVVLWVGGWGGGLVEGSRFRV